MAQDPENRGEWDLMREAGGFLNNTIVYGQSAQIFYALYLSRSIVLHLPASSDIVFVVSEDGGLNPGLLRRQSYDLSIRLDLLVIWIPTRNAVFLCGFHSIKIRIKIILELLLRLAFGTGMVWNLDHTVHVLLRFLQCSGYLNISYGSGSAEQYRNYGSGSRRPRSRTMININKTLNFFLEFLRIFDKIVRIWIFLTDPDSDS
jgi:hypothetical protein